MNASIIIQTNSFTSRRQCGYQFQFPPFVVCLSVSAVFVLLFRVGNFQGAFEENFSFAACRTALLES